VFINVICVCFGFVFLFVVLRFRRIKMYNFMCVLAYIRGACACVEICRQMATAVRVYISNSAAVRDGVCACSQAWSARYRMTLGRNLRGIVSCGIGAITNFAELSRLHRRPKLRPPPPLAPIDPTMANRRAPPHGGRAATSAEPAASGRVGASSVSPAWRRRRRRRRRADGISFPLCTQVTWPQIVVVST